MYARVVSSLNFTVQKTWDMIHAEKAQQKQIVKSYL